MPCTEEQFQEMPLDFVRDEQAIVSLTPALENGTWHNVDCKMHIAIFASWFANHVADVEQWDPLPHQRHVC